VKRSLRRVLIRLVFCNYIGYFRDRRKHILKEEIFGPKRKKNTGLVLSGKEWKSQEKPPLLALIQPLPKKNPNTSPRRSQRRKLLYLERRSINQGFQIQMSATCTAEFFKFDCGIAVHNMYTLSLLAVIKGVTTRLIVDALSEACAPFLKGGNSTFIAAIANSLFPQTEYQSLE